MDRANHESFCNLLSPQVSIPDSHVLIFLLFNCSKSAITLICDFIGDAELTLANLLDHVEFRIKSVTVLEWLWH